MTSKKRLIGNIGENITCRFHVKHGFNVLERNFLRKCGEIDIILEKENKLHFCEVKTVSRETYNKNSYNPADNVHYKKIMRLIRTINLYLIEKNVSRETEWQLDVAIVYLFLKDKKYQIEFILNIIPNVR